MSEKLNYTQATHNLYCVHAIGRNRNNYYMKCCVLKEMPNNKVKLLVFGERNWKYKEHIQKIRYVNKNRISKIKD